MAVILGAKARCWRGAAAGQDEQDTTVLGGPPAEFHSQALSGI